MKGGRPRAAERGVPEETSDMVDESSGPPRDAVIGDLAKRQHGVVSLHQLQLAGLGRAAVARTRRGRAPLPHPPRRLRRRPRPSHRQWPHHGRRARLRAARGCEPPQRGWASWPPTRQSRDHRDRPTAALGSLAAGCPRPRFPNAPPRRRHEMRRHSVYQRRSHPARPGRRRPAAATRAGRGAGRGAACLRSGRAGGRAGTCQRPPRRGRAALRARRARGRAWAHRERPRGPLPRPVPHGRHPHAGCQPSGSRSTAAHPFGPTFSGAPGSS